MEGAQVFWQFFEVVLAVLAGFLGCFFLFHPLMVSSAFILAALGCLSGAFAASPAWLACPLPG